MRLHANEDYVAFCHYHAIVFRDVGSHNAPFLQIHKIRPRHNHLSRFYDSYKIGRNSPFWMIVLFSFNIILWKQITNILMIQVWAVENTSIDQTISNGKCHVTTTKETDSFI